MAHPAHPLPHPKHPPDECADLALCLAEMKKSRLKITAPRKALLHALIESHGPYTAENLHQRVTPKVCDLVTIYRTLASLEKAGLIQRCDFGDGTARYELAGKNHHHHHVVCRQCRQIEVLDDCALENLNRVPQKLGYTDISHSLEFFGLCPACAAVKPGKSEVPGVKK